MPGPTGPSDLPASFISDVLQLLHDDKDLAAAELISKAWLAVARGHPRDVTLRFQPRTGYKPDLGGLGAWGARRRVPRLALCVKEHDRRIDLCGVSPRDYSRLQRCLTPPSTPLDMWPLDLRPLARVTSLTTLDLAAYEGLVEWSGLKSLRSLQKLRLTPTGWLYVSPNSLCLERGDIAAYYRERAGDVLALDESLSRLPQLVALDLLSRVEHEKFGLRFIYRFMLHWYPPSCLEKLAGLTSLAVNCASVTGVNWALPSLQSLRIQVSAPEIGQTENLLRLAQYSFGPCLTMLALQNVVVRGTFADLPPGVKDLRFVGLRLGEGALPSLAPLKHQLTQLRLGCPQMAPEDAGLGELTGLRVLRLHTKLSAHLDLLCMLQGLQELHVEPYFPGGLAGTPLPHRDVHGRRLCACCMFEAQDEWEARLLRIGARLPALQLLRIDLLARCLCGVDRQDVPPVSGIPAKLAELDARLTGRVCRVVHSDRDPSSESSRI